MKILVFLLILLNLACPALAGAPSAQDFAYGFLLDTEGDGALYSLVVPDEVYRNVQRADLGDVRVLNSSGEVVPHVLRASFEKEAELRSEGNVPFFPFVEPAEGAKGAGVGITAKRGGDGMIISIDNGTATLRGDKGIKSYLLDLSGLKWEPGTLEFVWTRGDLPYATVRLQQSDDLIHWRPLIDRATLADLEYNGYRVAQKNIVLPVKPYKYLRMNGDMGQRLPDLQKVTALSKKMAIRQQRRWLSLGKGAVVHDEARTLIDFSSEFHLAATGVRLHLPETNSMIRASVQSRSGLKNPWISRCTAVFYSLKIGGSGLENDVCFFGQTTDSQWRLEIIEDGAGLENPERAPTLELGFLPAELIFVARGKAPFTLAYGNGRLAGDSRSSATEMILQAVSGKEAGQLVRPAVLRERRELGGKGALETPPPPLPWKKWLLWAVLVSGICLLAFMVRHLHREMRARGDHKPENDENAA